MWQLLAISEKGKKDRKSTLLISASDRTANRSGGKSELARKKSMCCWYCLLAMLIVGIIGAIALLLCRLSVKIVNCK